MIGIIDIVGVSILNLLRAVLQVLNFKYIPYYR